jgi:hypothetical protein
MVTENRKAYLQNINQKWLNSCAYISKNRLLIEKLIIAIIVEEIPLPRTGVIIFKFWLLSV